MTRPVQGSARCRALLEELSRYLDGDLPPARRRAVERHIAACARCESMEACLKRTIAACRAEGGARPPRDVRARAAGRVKALLAAGRATPSRPRPRTRRSS
jgi:anti-sigma factor RsiW